MKYYLARRQQWAFRKTLDAHHRRVGVSCGAAGLTHHLLNVAS